MGHNTTILSPDMFLFLPFMSPANKPYLIVHQKLTWEEDDSIAEDQGSIQEVNFPKKSDMQYWILAAIVFICVRKLVERTLLQPFGKWLGIKETRCQTPRSIPCKGGPSSFEKLEDAYSVTKKMSHAQILLLSQQCNMEPREIERWLRKRRSLDKPSTLVKFSESGWRLICYVGSTTIGLYAIWDSPCLRSATECWKNYPNHSISEKLWWYYLFGAGFYCSLLITQVFDVRRKDFWEMFIHHVITITLIIASWMENLLRIGVLILLLHDCVDIFVEAAKMANYSKNDKLATGIFVIFTVVWIITRLVIYPVYIVWHNGQKAVEYMRPEIAYLLVALLVLLLGLHIFWTLYIGKMAVKVVSSDVIKDARSSSECESTEEETLKPKTTSISKGFQSGKM